MIRVKLNEEQVDDLIPSMVGTRDEKDALEYADKKLITTHPKYRVGQVIEFWGGYDNDIRYSTKIIGFDRDGEIYLFWDAYWFPIKDEPRRDIKVVG